MLANATICRNPVHSVGHWSGMCVLTASKIPELLLLSGPVQEHNGSPMRDREMLRKEKVASKERKEEVLGIESRWESSHFCVANISLWGRQ